MGARSAQGLPIHDTRVHRYGEDHSQYGELTLPDGAPRGVVVVIHGGFWKQAYGLELGRPLADDLAARGWAAWNLEYRRVGNGGGAPETLDDVAAGIDALADLGLDLSTVVTLGHSAGGHLAVWAATRGGITAAVSQAGVLDLRSAHADGLGGGAVEAFLGHPPTDEDDCYDPLRLVPLAVPVWCVHAPGDDTVPISQSRDYVAAATSAGGMATLVEVPGDHYSVIDPASQGWGRTLEILEEV
jgi:acetyl esterase/lipase